MKDILKYGLPWIIFIALVAVGRNLLSTEPNGWMRQAALAAQALADCESSK